MKAKAGGFVYAIGQAWEAPVKIGVANDVVRRLDSLQAGNPSLLQVLWQTERLPDPFAVESLLHETFADCRLRGEWFVSLTSERLSVAASEAIQRAPRQRKEFDAESTAAKLAADFLITRLLREGLSIEDAIGSLSKSTGLGRSTIWALRYRPRGQITVAPYASIAAELWRVMGQPPFSTAMIPSAEDVHAVLRGENAPIRKPPRDLETLTALTDTLAAAISEAEAALGNTSINTTQTQGEAE